MDIKSEQPNWLNHNNADFTSFYAMIKEARASRVWIYQVSKKKWYTPDEMVNYVNENQEQNINLEKSTDDFKLMNPQKGLQDRISFIKKVSDEMFEFNKRIKDYYK